MIFNKNNELDANKMEKLKQHTIINFDDYHIIDRVHEKRKQLNYRKINHRY